MALVDRTVSSRVRPKELAFGTPRSLSLIGGFIALFLVPLRPEDTWPLAPLFVVFVPVRPLSV
jgi:hypothetical protein